MSRYFTSDHHFGHANILKYEDEKRRDVHGSRFTSVEQMNDYLVDQWNLFVTQDDLVYCLGDFCYDFEQMRDVLPFLNGKKILITGNHDPFFKKMIDRDPQKKMEAQDLALQAGFSEVYLHHKIDIPGIGLVLLAHFPYEPPIKEGLPADELRYLANRPPRGKEKLLLHGHVHSQWLLHKYPGLPRMMNVGVEMWGMRPVSDSQIVEAYKAAMC